MRKASVWLDSEDKPHENLELCRQAELEIIFRASDPEDPWHLGPDAAKAAAQIVLLNQARVIAVLTTTKRSHPGARKAFGAKRKLKVDNRNAMAIKALVGSWRECQERVSFHRRVPQVKAIDAPRKGQQRRPEVTAPLDIAAYSGLDATAAGHGTADGTAA